jgi:hypothetical protein
MEKPPGKIFTEPGKEKIIFQGDSNTWKTGSCFLGNLMKYVEDNSNIAEEGGVVLKHTHM